MLERVRELWADRPVLVAAAGIAPVAFAITLLVLFLVVGSGDATQSQQQAVSQQDQSSDESAGDQAAQQQDGARQPEVTVIVQGGQPQQEQQDAAASAADASDQAEAQQAASQQAQASQTEDQPQAQQQAEQPEPLVVAGFEVVPLSGLIEAELNEAEYKHGSDGSEGAILPLGNGVVRSSGEQHATSWELIVPSAGLRSAVVSLGRTPNGAMGSPDNPDVVGWLDSTPRPGEVGNTLLAGHRDFEDISGNIGTGVCWELNNTQVGDHMLIWDDQLNVYYVYTVTEAVTVDPTDPAAGRYLRNTDVAVVTLITCTGSFNTETHRYSHRLVVVGELAAVASPDA